MFNYIKKRAIEQRTTLLKYAGAFGDGLSNDCLQDPIYFSGKVCPEMLQAYKDGKAYRKELTQKQVGGKLGEEYEIETQTKPTL